MAAKFPDQMKLFCRLYVSGGCRNAFEAALKAGYSPKGAASWSSKTLARRDVGDYVQKLVAMHRRGLPLDGPLLHVVDGPKLLAPPSDEPIAGGAGNPPPPPLDGHVMGPDDDEAAKPKRPYGVRRILTEHEELERRVLVEEAFRVYHTAMGDYGSPVDRAVLIETQTAGGLVVQDLVVKTVEIRAINLPAANQALKFLSEQLELIHSARANAGGVEDDAIANEDSLVKAEYRQKLIRMSAERRKRSAATG